MNRKTALFGRQTIGMLCFMIFYVLSAEAQYYRTVPKHRPFKLDTIHKIWDSAPHNAFTDITYFKKKWYCIFREGNTHYSGNDFGKVRIICSKDGENWESIALIAEDSTDLRDPKLSVTPKGKLMINYCALRFQASPGDTAKIIERESAAMFSRNGKKWSQRYKLNLGNEWAWRITWNNDTAYTITYTEKGQVKLYKSADGLNYNLITEKKLKDHPNEATILFVGDTMFAIIRCEENNTVYFGESFSPFTEWYYRKYDRFTGSPNMQKLSDNSVFATFRGYEGGNAMLKFALVRHYKIYPLINILSGGDCGYAGMYVKNDVMWISYYSSHEGKPSIYLAKIVFP